MYIASIDSMSSLFELDTVLLVPSSLSRFDRLLLTPFFFQGCVNAVLILFALNDHNSFRSTVKASAYIPTYIHLPHLKYIISESTLFSGCPMSAANITFGSPSLAVDLTFGYRTPTMSNNRHVASSEQTQNAAEIGAMCYMECSALMRESCDAVLKVAADVLKSDNPK